MTQHDMVDGICLRVVDDSMGRMSDHDFEGGRKPHTLRLRAQLCKIDLEMLACPLDFRLGLDFVRRLRRPGDRKDLQGCSDAAGKTRSR